jgi:hypothetical protein
MLLAEESEHRFTTAKDSLQIAVPAYKGCTDLLSALYASQRLSLLFRGVLLVGY